MRVEDVLHIEAAPESVWAVTVDVERWPEWTPTITSVVRLDEGPFGLGSAARIKQPGQPESVWTVTEFVAGRRFVWESRRPGLWMRACHDLEADGSGTKSVLWVETSGVSGVILWPLLRWVVGWALRRENRGLKMHCEGGIPMACGLRGRVPRSGGKTR